ncbi:[Fe-Fe] hydrogenase large subunit C-terminal domain-containing protein [Clostridium sp. KNHs216]|jgi:Iron only hydrogenase large subunit, C-terminal domain|uniref:[Fe-Fe] hydrogenase large subunit C-terminal domain-containing protein n=1 Tax=Clostridium sp. KNHs216 TaxID=1550235 RepID=UPI000570DB84|nr:[Fe-Fe] hydrogenase large subunit C-terminal domain-containing protein [Clostridium sp. KNHs216]TQI66002.1 iron only hydrogenase large subunit-like protein [Clostridium sp. KNHs216]
MTTFNELYERLVKASVENREPQELEKIREQEFDPHHLDCLLNPEKYAPVLRIGECECSSSEQAPCEGKCLFDALYRDEKGNVQINKDLCVGCSECVESCQTKKLTASRDILPALAAVHEAKAPVYAMIAPAFISQFSKDVTPGKLRTAFKMLGFAGMVEVALFADILTLKEALEFNKNIVKETDFQLTSCCCPMWIAMIRKVYHELMPHVPGAVSPMVACGRAIKAIHPDALTVFIGPCIAKKAEAREPDISDSTDFVLTFQEIQDVFEFAKLDLAALPEDERDHSSRAGRIYARSGGVSEAVQRTSKRLSPDRKITVRAHQADGVPACKAMINDLLAGKIDANFLEGMGCVGGCVGGPKALIPREEGRENVNQYGQEAVYQTPIDNPYVIELLHRLGFDTVESLIEHSDIFTRKF